VALDEVPTELGFALAAWNCEANPWVKMDRKSPGYVAQEVETLKALKR
jgi:hypothetical protein